MPKVLVIEDSKNIREEICEILQFENFEVIYATDGEKGLEQAVKELPDLIISDIKMPKLNGYELLSELKKLPKTKSIPFIFLSGKTERPDLRKGMNMGAEDYLIKPINTDELIKVVKDKLKKQQVLKEKIDKLVEEREYSLKEAGKMAKIGYWMINNHTGTLVWSEAVHQIYGTDPKEEIPDQQLILNLLDSASKKKLLKARLNLANTGASYDLELLLINLKNEKRWIRNIGDPLFNDKNEIIGRRGIAQDITEQKAKQNELDVNNRKLQEVNNALNEAQELSHLGSWKYLIEGDAVAWSKELFHIFDYPQELGAPNYSEHSLLYTEESFTRMNQAVQNCLQYEIPYDIELDICTTKGALKHVIARGHVLKDTENNVIGCYGTAQDVTERKLVQNELDLKSRKLHDANNALNEAQKLSQIGSWYWDLKSNKIEWSNETFHIWGLTPEKEAPDFDALVNLIHIEDQELFQNAIRQAIDFGVPYDIEHRINFPNGKQKIIRGIGKPILGANAKVIRLAGTTQDITAQKLSIRKIEKAKEMYGLLADNTHDIICLQEPDSTFKYISPSIKNLLGYDQEELLGKQVFDIVHPKDVKALKKVLEIRTLDHKSMDAYTLRILHKEGHFVWLEFLTSPVYKEGKVNYYVTSTRDITQWILAKQEIQEYQTSLQKLTTEITLVEEKQKKEIATNIHDQLSQCLIISKMKINELKKNPQLEVIEDDLKFIETHISEALENSRKITYELSPPVLYQLGIIDALNWLLDEVETTHKVKCKLHTNVATMKLDDVKSILLYRSIQEVINNAIKYASASLITLDLKKNKNRLYIVVTDDGVGFNAALLNSHNHSGSGFGLFTVRERIRNIQGKFKITSKINVGTTVNFFIPLHI